VANLAVGIVLLLAAGADAFYQRLEQIPVEVPEPAGATSLPEPTSEPETSS